MRSHIVAAMLAFSVALSITPARAKDLILRQRVTTTGPRSEMHDSMQYWSGNHVVTDNDERRVIIDLDAETMTTADKKQHTFYTQTFAEMRAQTEALQAEMQKEMKNLSPEARAMMEKMGVGAKTGEATVSLKPTGKSEKIAGYDAKEYAIEGGPMHGSIWAAEGLQSPAGPKAGAAFAKMFGALG